MQIINKKSVPQTKKEDGTNIWYYIFPENEIHYNEIPPGTVQPWHHHEQIDESIYIIQGSLRIDWVHEGQIYSSVKC